MTAMTVEAHNAARLRAAEAARDTYLADNPEPSETSFRCPRCKAPVGQPCVWPTRVNPPGSGFHAPRMDRSNDAFRGRQVKSMQAYDRAWDEYTNRHGLPR